jgi:hypothetical protein
MKRLTIAMLGLVSLLCAGCFSRVHMTETYARAYRAAFSRQVVNPGGSNARTPKGLDALEAGIVVDNYRAQLAPKTAASEQPMIMFSSQASQMGYSPPSAPPSPK